MKKEDSIDVKEYIKELKETYWEGYNAGYDAAIKNMRSSIGEACISASALKRISIKSKNTEV